MAQIAHVDAMADYTDEGEEKGEAVDQGQEGLDSDDRVDKAREELTCEYGVLLYQFGEVIKSACYELMGQLWSTGFLVERGKGMRGKGIV